MSKPLIKQQYTLSDILGEVLSYDDAVSLIASDPKAQQHFDSLTPESQQKAISFIQGNSGLKILGDKCFKDIMKPKTHPERLNSLLTAILGRKITIKSVLPREGEKLSEEGSFVIMDILVEDSEGTTINVEIQRAGYLFPGKRSSCYLSDLVMRQYNKVRSEKGKNFSYHHMKPIILIVIMENSSGNFSAVSPHYIHREQLTYDSGAVVNNLTQTIYISLDTFHSVIQNINTKLDAWLTFLGSDAPADIIKLINAYPEFIEYYKDLVEYRKHPKELMYMFSEALAIMDRNMERYMIDDWKATIEKQKAELIANESAIKQSESIIKELDSTIQEQISTIQEQAFAIQKLDSTVKEQSSTIEKLQVMVESLMQQNLALQSK